MHVEKRDGRSAGRDDFHMFIRACGAIESEMLIIAINKMRNINYFFNN